MPPLLSIVTVNLNDAAGLAATARSLIAQRHADFEWLVLDGGSTDGSIEVIRAHQSVIRAWSSGPDRGVYDAMNHGLRRARGDFVMFLNAGDRLADPDALAAAAGALADAPGVDLLFGGTMLELPDGRRLSRAPRPPIPWLRFGLPAYHQATLIRRGAHLAVPHDLDLRVSADYGAIASLATRGARVGRLHRPLAVRRCHPDSLSERATAARFADFIRVKREILGAGRGSTALAVARLAVVHLGYRIRTRRLVTEISDIAENRDITV